MKKTLAIIGCLMAGSSMADTAFLSAFEVSVPDQWTQSIEARPEGSAGSILSLHPPGGDGTLKLSFLNVPEHVTEGELRNLTNVAHSIPLKWQSWGDLAGFQYDYSEGGQSIRQWWLKSEHGVVFVSYQHDSKTDGIDPAIIDETVRSLTSINPN